MVGGDREGVRWGQGGWWVGTGRMVGGDREGRVVGGEGEGTYYLTL